MTLLSDIITDMFEVLRLELISPAQVDRVIHFQKSDGTTLCQVRFENVVQDTSVLGNFFFEDVNGSRVLRNLVSEPGINTVSQFKIKNIGSQDIITGSVSQVNGGGDIVFNTVDWEEDQVIIISSLRIVFPAES